jgi:hypothetical protein
VNLILALLYVIVCIRAGFNRHGHWTWIPCVLLGAFIVGDAVGKLGSTPTFFGVELGVIDAKDQIVKFSFILGHAQYNGLIMLLLGAWFAFTPTAELTSITWVLSCMVTLIVDWQLRGKRSLQNLIGCLRKSYRVTRFRV